MKTTAFKTSTGETCFKCELKSLVTIGTTRTEAMCNMMKLLHKEKERVTGAI